MRLCRFLYSAVHVEGEDGEQLLVGHFGEQGFVGSSGAKNLIGELLLLAEHVVDAFLNRAAAARPGFLADADLGLTLQYL